ncbi:RagB/SusD family nutrient uptake outer membrane protein [Dyadobacter sp. CY323]|uniref:RagB/SusD family nutrient uptake outer membrane protein n=1 Tax=Dyadobacter sp. CY323 TaxID=2907302 RepID=UPI001F301C70|nr:RagB/SusD family nutrient uptake outer membrane protein [Dyadobacter sp. CY323]MCE6990501.1 RagB/SusD family nutrient uptake outer membrane protein [Dyadobacter sp. CY323]
MKYIPYFIGRTLSRYPVLLVVFCLSMASCKDDFLEEKPVASLSSEVVLSSKAGFESYITALHMSAREELGKFDSFGWYINQQMGTDIACSGENAAANFRNYDTYLTSATQVVQRYWDWAYSDMLLKANTIIVYANKPELNGIWANEAEKNAIIAEARFFRAYTHNFLANLYGSVPIVDTIYAGPKTDFVKNTREEVYQSARADLEFASKWLPATVVKANEGRVVKGAADHLLSEVYISLKQYDKAVESASLVINSGIYSLMTTRFGSEKDLPGDVYSDLFKDGNQNRSSGNLESIFNWQFEDQTPGGQGGNNGNYLLRAWAPFYINVKDPDGKPGMVIVDSLGRGVGWVRPTNYFLYNLWEDNWSNDIRNSRYNIRRDHYYTNPASAYFRKMVEKSHYAKLDTFQMLYPTLRKVEGKVGKSGNNTTGRTFKDVMVYRLAETYLLRAEAYMYKGDLEKAATDINKVRLRSQAKPVLASKVNLDYILDERGRELITEEPRHRTLVRTGKLVERVRKYNMRADTRATIQDKHAFWPIPQTAIDANFSRKLEQNPGY